MLGRRGRGGRGEGGVEGGGARLAGLRGTTGPRPPGPWRARRAAPPGLGLRAVTPLALLLVLIAAFAHAGWNALSKRAPGGAAFVWSQMLVGSVCMAPVAAIGIWLDDGARVSLAIVLMGIASGAAHTVYFVLLQ